MPGPYGESASLHISADAGDLARLYRRLDTEAEASHLPGGKLYGMHLVLEEVVANVAMHAFAPDERWEIIVRLHVFPNAASLVVEDTGRPFGRFRRALSQRGGSAHRPGLAGAVYPHLEHCHRSVGGGSSVAA
jgi:anti-sigma regulatory factor (Ser/Thr protein kinase)